MGAPEETATKGDRAASARAGDVAHPGRSAHPVGADHPGALPDRGDARPTACCPLYHEAVELVGRRWTGAILRVLMEGALRFSEIAQSVPELSDRLLSERMKELERRGMVERRVISGPPLRVEYSLSQMGRELEPALFELQRWANRWLGERRISTRL